jgi:hypothetical protein
VSNQNAGADKRACPRAWAKLTAFFAGQMALPDRLFGDESMRRNCVLLAASARAVLHELEAMPCDCADCTRQHSTGWKTWRDAQ